MSNKPGYQNRQEVICIKIRSLFTTLAKDSSKYDQIAPKIEYWVEYTLREGSMTIQELVEGISFVAWDHNCGSFANVGRFLKEFRNAPHRSERARAFVDQISTYILQWFAVAAADEICTTPWDNFVSHNWGDGFVSAASFIGYLVEQDLLSRKLVRRHLIKPLINHDDDGNLKTKSYSAFRAKAIYQLFTIAGSTLLWGHLEPEDVKVCLKILNSWERTLRFDSEKLKEFGDSHASWVEQTMQMKEKCNVDIEEPDEDQEGGEDAADPGTPVAFTPQTLPTVTTGIKIDPSIFQSIETSWATRVVEPSHVPFADAQAGEIPSPSLTVSTFSDLTPTELGEDINHEEGHTTTRHDAFYFEDGNVEIVCDDTVFRVHSTIVSYSSSKLRDILSRSTLSHALTIEGCPRVTVSDGAEDFANLLKMVYTPGFPPRHKVPKFPVFASLLRMATKYNFSDVRDQLIEDIRSAYYTRWEDFQNAKVLGEDVFGSPKPHPNAVLNLFEEQNIRFAIPFAAYRASIGGFSSLMTNEPGAILSRRTLATTIYGMEILQSLASDAARMVVYGRKLPVCPDKTCVLKVSKNRVSSRAEASEKLYNALVDKRKGGVLSPPSMGHILCAKCAKPVEETQNILGPIIWKRLAPVFQVSASWDDL